MVDSLDIRVPSTAWALMASVHPAYPCSYDRLPLAINTSIVNKTDALKSTFPKYLSQTSVAINLWPCQYNRQYRIYTAKDRLPDVRETPTPTPSPKYPLAQQTSRSLNFTLLKKKKKKKDYYKLQKTRYMEESTLLPRILNQRKHFFQTTNIPPNQNGNTNVEMFSACQEANQNYSNFIFY